MDMKPASRAAQPSFFLNILTEDREEEENNCKQITIYIDAKRTFTKKNCIKKKHWKNAMFINKTETHISKEKMSTFLLSYPLTSILCFFRPAAEAPQAHNFYLC